MGQIAAQKGYFQLRGRIYNINKEPLASAQINVFENNTSIGSDKTSTKGVFSLRLKLNTIYKVEISKTGYHKSVISIDTKVPNDKKDTYFQLFRLLVLESDDKPAVNKETLKFMYNEIKNEFTDSEPTPVFVESSNSKLKIKQLESELRKYKLIAEEQKKMITQADEIVSDLNNIRQQAKNYSDSIINEANLKAIQLVKIANEDTTKNSSKAIEKTTKTITKEDFEKLAVNEQEFLNKKIILELQKQIQELTSRQNKSNKDSLNIKKGKLSIRKELFDLAKYQLEIDRLEAKSEEDHKKIEERESRLFLMEQEILLAEEELENANNKILLKDLELKNKNIMLTSFIVGSILLLIVLVIIVFFYRDKKKTNKILEYQNQELEKLSVVASETSNAIVITDNQGDFTWVNKGYKRLFGYKLEEVTGENAKSLIHTKCGDEVNNLIKKSLTTGEVVNYELKAQSKSGEDIWIQTTLTPLVDRTGKVSKLIVIDSDISKIKEAEEEILAQSRQLKRQNDQIMASINYGKRIQDAILPSESIIKSYFPDSFIYFKPRDIVSGDFYWLSIQDNKLFVAAVDCTGHGVPGAFMSLIGNQLLNHIVNERKILKPSEILKELNTGVIKALSQSEENEEREDGMDLTICRFDKEKKEVQVACANHTALIVNGEEVQEIEGDEISIGERYSKNDDIEFTNYIFPFMKDSTMYLFSDGYPDQLGGPKNKKFLAGKFRNFLIENQKNSMKDQIGKLSDTLDSWKGENKQTDDILVMGIRLV